MPWGNQSWEEVSICATIAIHLGNLGKTLALLEVEEEDDNNPLGR
jgi:hypothetical protein